MILGLVDSIAATRDIHIFCILDSVGKVIVKTMIEEESTTFTEKVLSKLKY